MSDNLKFGEYLAHLNEMAEKHPRLLELDVITSKDDEGNGYNKVFYHPSAVIYSEDTVDDTDNINDVNAVCLN